MAYDGLMNGDAQNLLDEWTELKNYRHTFDAHWQEVADLIFPRSGLFTRDWSPGEKRTHRQYDAFPTAALNRFAAAMESGLMPHNTIWHEATTGIDELDEDREVALYLDRHNQSLYRQRYQASANFRSQAHEHLLSLGAFGTGVMFAPQMPDGGICYKSVHLGSFWFWEDFQGRPSGGFRLVRPSTIQVVEEFGSLTPDRIRMEYDKGNYHRRWEFVHSVKPRKDYVPGSGGDTRYPYTNTWVWAEGEEIVRDGGYFEMPYFVSRYVTSADEVYGRSPAMMLLPDIKMANETMRIVINAANLMIDPPMLLPHDNVMAEFSLEPGARNYGGVDDQGNQLARPLVDGAKPDLGQQIIQQLHSTIDDAFLGVYFRVLLENPNMTATQAMLIAQQQGQMAQPMIGRQMTEWLDVMIRRESGILSRSGEAPEPPEALVEYVTSTGRPLGVRYKSPLVRQAEQDEVVSILRSIEQLTPVAQIDETVFRPFKWDAIGPRIAQLNGVSPELMYSQEELQEMAMREREEQQMQAALQTAPVAADAAKNLAQANQMTAAQAGMGGALPPMRQAA